MEESPAHVRFACHLRDGQAGESMHGQDLLGGVQDSVGLAAI
jgi:hypothetical protein